MSFRFYSGNKLERLAATYVSEIYASHDPKAVFLPDRVIVQTQGMASWLRLYVAEQSEIAVNIDFPFLRSFMEDLLKKIFPEFVASDELLSGEIIVWKIWKLLGTDSYPELSSYYKDDPSGRKRYQLSLRIADLFDQYGMYRSKLTGEWLEKASHEDWQSRMYCELFRENISLSAWIDRFCSETFDPAMIRKNLACASVSIFGVGSMPPQILKFYLSLSRYINIHFFYLNPSETYWADTCSARESRKLEEKTGEKVLQNPLLGFLGVHGRDFFELLTELEGNGKIELFNKCFFSFEPEKRKTALSRIQEDINENILRHPRFSEETEIYGGPLPVEKEDDSIRIHDCHSTLRQIEVLHDVLLDIFSRNPQIQPRDVIVMAPDISKCAPAVDAVFGNGPLKNLYSVSDASGAEYAPNAEAFLELVKLPSSRYELSRIRLLMEAPAFRAGRKLTEEDVEKCFSFIVNSGVCWGLDQEQRKTFSGEASPDFTWKEAFERLIAGYAVLSDPLHQADAPLIPLEFADGAGNAEKIGSFLCFIQDLFRMYREFRKEKTLEEWSEVLLQTAERFMLPDDDNYQEIASLKRAIRKMGECARLAEVQELLPVSVIPDILSGSLQFPGSEKSFLRGKITFCSMIPMRSIPKKIIAILNMNQGEFPRKDVSMNFDRLLKDPTKYRRSVRNEDRYLFLEAILACREKMLLFYNGRDSQRDSEYPPALPLAEFMDVLDASFECKAEFFLRHHKLQAFDPDYFDKKEPLRFHSFSKENYNAAKALLAPKSSEPLLPCGLLPEEDPVQEKSVMNISLKELENMLLHPLRSYASCCGGLSFSDSFQQEEGSDDEKLSLSGLEDYNVCTRASEYLFRHKLSEEKVYSIIRKTALLPAGICGRKVWETKLEILKNLPQKMQDLIPEEISVPLNVQTSRFRITGTLRAVVPKNPEENVTQLFFKFFAIKGKDAVRWYLQHLLLQKYFSGRQVETLLWSPENDMQCVSLSNAEYNLEELLALAARSGTEKIPLFPDTSFAYACGRKDEELSKAFYYSCYDRIKAAYTEKGDSVYNKDIRYFYGQTFTEDELFRSVAEIVFKPYVKKECV